MNKPCKYPGCPAILRLSGYCEAHQPVIEAGRRAHAAFYDQHKRPNRADLATAQAIRSSAAWQRVRRLKLSSNPVCEDPFGIHAKAQGGVPAAQVHHILPVGKHPELAFHAENLMALCTRCHAKIERRGGQIH